jgi:hypothetical protein
VKLLISEERLKPRTNWSVWLKVTLGGVIESYSKFELHAVVKFLQAEAVSQSEVHRRPASVYGQNVFSRNEVSV